MTESRILQRKKNQKNTTHGTRDLTHFKVFLISSLAFSYKHHNQNTFVCFDFQNSTTPKHEKISLQLSEVTSMLQFLFLYQDHPAFADFLESTERLAVRICPTSVLGGGKPKTDGCHGHLWLKEHNSSYTTGTCHTMCTPGLAFKREKGDKPLGLHMHGSYAIYLQKKKPPLLCVNCVVVLSI